MQPPCSLRRACSLLKINQFGQVAESKRPTSENGLVDGIRCLIGNGNGEFFLDSQDEFDEIETIAMQIFGEPGVWLDLLPSQPQLFAGQVAHTLFQVGQRHRSLQEQIFLNRIGEDRAIASPFVLVKEGQFADSSILSPLARSPATPAGFDLQGRQPAPAVAKRVDALEVAQVQDVAAFLRRVADDGDLAGAMAFRN